MMLVGMTTLGMTTLGMTTVATTDAPTRRILGRGNLKRWTFPG
jgi:hypothetical protein